MLRKCEIWEQCWHLKPNSKFFASVVVPRIWLVLTSSQSWSLWVEPELCWKPYPTWLKVEIWAPTALMCGNPFKVVSCSRFLLSFGACVSRQFHSRMPLESDQPDLSACNLPSQMSKPKTHSNNCSSRCSPYTPARLIDTLTINVGPMPVCYLKWHSKKGDSCGREGVMEKSSSGAGSRCTAPASSIVHAAWLLAAWR